MRKACKKFCFGSTINVSAASVDPSGDQTMVNKPQGCIASQGDTNNLSIGLKTTADVQLLLMEQEILSTGETGQTSWIATGLKIEETQ